MKDYSGIIQDIKDNITENGKGEITGRDLREILLEAIGNVSVDMGELDRRIEAILGGENYDDIINSWAELEQFLSGLDESSNLVELLSYKADKSDVYSRSDINTKLEDYTKTDDLGALALKDEVEMSDIKNLEDALDKKLDKEGGEIENNLLVKGELKMGVLFVPTSDGEPSSYRLAIGELGEGADIPSSGEGGLGSVTIMLGDVPYYSDSNGIVRLPAYPTGGGGDMSGYLPLSGGTISGGYSPLTINRNDGITSYITFSNYSKVLGYLGFEEDGPAYTTTNWEIHRLLHTGNTNNYFAYREWSNQDANTASMGANFTYANNAPFTGPLATFSCGGYDLQLNGGYGAAGMIAYRTKNGDNGTWNSWRQLVDEGNVVNYNAGSATKLQTARTIWGQSFDGTEDIVGADISLNRGTIYWHNDSSNYHISCPVGSYGGVLEYQAYSGHRFLGGNVLIGTTTDNGNRLQVQGAITLTTALRMIFNNNPTCGLYPDSWISGADASRLWLYNTGKVAICGEQGVEIHSDLTANGHIITTKLSIDASYGVSPTAQGIVINTTNNANDYGWNPGIGFHIPGITYGTIKLTNDSLFRFFNSSLTGYFGIVTGDITAYGNIFANGYQLPTSPPDNPVSGGYYLYVGTLGAGATIS